MQFGQGFHDRQPQPQSPIFPRARHIHLTEWQQNIFRLFRRKADPIVADGECDQVMRLAEFEHDAAARRGVLGGIVNEICRQLSQPRPITHDPHGRIGNQPLEAMALGGNGTGGHLDGVVHRISQVDAADLQLEFPACEPRHIEQVVRETDQVIRLPFDDSSDTLGRR